VRTTDGNEFFIQLTDETVKEVGKLVGEDFVKLHLYNDLAPPALTVRRKFTRR
jgi:hypothetical protein